MDSWRDRARPIIAAVLEATKGQDARAVKKALREAYPFGEREMHPYKVWLDEIKRQTGAAGKARAERIARLDAARGQQNLFDGEKGS